MKMMNSLGIRHKIVGVFSGLFVVATVAIFLFFPWRQKVQLTHSLHDKAAVMTKIISRGAMAGLLFEDAASVQSALEGVQDVGDVVFAVVLTPDGEPFASYKPEAAEPYLEDIQSALEEETSEFDYDEVFIQRVPVASDGSTLGWTAVGLSKSSVRAGVSASRKFALTLSLIMLVAGVGTFWWTTSQMIRPVEVLKDAAEHVAGGEIDVTVHVETNDELGQLATSFNQMVTQIRHSLDEAEKSKAAAEEAARKIEEAHAASLAQQEYLSTSIERILVAMEKFADGDLRIHLDAERDDDIGRLYNGFNRAVANIQQVLLHVVRMIESTVQVAAEIKMSTEQLASGAQEQSVQAMEVAAAVEEMVQTISTNASSATHTAEVADRSGHVARDGGRIVSQTVDKIRKIAGVVTSSAEIVQRLGESSNEIGEIIQVINEIADQTNLLALNAAIEAARAGDQGRGFAVVADEVRKLAERTTAATKEISSMITTIQHDTMSAVDAMRQGTDEVSEGIRLADDAGAALDNIVESSTNVVDMITQIAAATEEQAATSQEIARNLETISKVTNESADGVSHIAGSAEQLRRMTGELQELVRHFQLDGSGPAVSRPATPPQRSTTGARPRTLV